MQGMNYVLAKGFLATGSSAYVRGQLVKFATGTTLQPAQIVGSTASNDAIAGVTLEALDAAKVTTGKASIGVQMMGIAEVVFGGGSAVAVGAKVMPGTTGGSNAGQCILAATSLNTVVGIALTAPSTQGDYFSILLTPGLVV